MNAAGPWNSIKKVPTEGRSYLIEADYGAGPVYDVAFYNGKSPDGSHWWTMGNVNILPKSILKWAEIL